MRKFFLIVLFIGSLFFSPIVLAAPDNGTIDSIHKYAWGDYLGWLNFGTSEGNVHITDTRLTGYVWSDNYGWINLSPSSTTYVANDGNGTLSGFAWGEQIGWIDFTGVTIDANGNFLGFASTTHQGKISFNCSNTASCANSDFKVATDWRPYSVRISSPSPASPLAGVSGSGGIYFIAPPPPTLHTPYWNSSSQKMILTGTGRADDTIDVIINQNNARNHIAVVQKDKTFTFELSLVPGNYSFIVRAHNSNYLGAVSSASQVQFGIVPSPPLATQSEILPTPFTSSTILIPAKIKFLKNLSLGSRNRDIQYLQKFLNANGFVVALHGPGSSGKETLMFGAGTKNALLKFQNKFISNSIIKRGQLDTLTRKFINTLQ